MDTRVLHPRARPNRRPHRGNRRWRSRSRPRRHGCRPSHRPTDGGAVHRSDASSSAAHRRRRARRAALRRLLRRRIRRRTSTLPATPKGRSSSVPATPARFERSACAKNAAQRKDATSQPCPERDRTVRVRFSYHATFRNASDGLTTTRAGRGPGRPATELPAAKQHRCRSRSSRLRASARPTNGWPKRLGHGATQVGLEQGRNLTPIGGRRSMSRQTAALSCSTRRTSGFCAGVATDARGRSARDQRDHCRSLDRRGRHDLRARDDGRKGRECAAAHVRPRWTCPRRDVAVADRPSQIRIGTAGPIVHQSSSAQWMPVEVEGRPTIGVRAARWSRGRSTVARRQEGGRPPDRRRSADRTYAGRPNPAVVGRTERDRPGRSPACRAAGHRRGSRDASLHRHQRRVRSARPRSARCRSTLRTGFRELGGGALRSRASGYAGTRCISSARHRRDSSSTASTWR